MNKNLFINIILAIICIYFFISNIDSLQSKDLSIFNKIVKILNSSFILIFLFYVLYLYRNGVAGLKLLNLMNNSKENQLVVIINNFIHIFSLGFITFY